LTVRTSSRRASARSRRAGSRLNYEAIEQELRIEPETVAKHVQAVYQALGFRTRADFCRRISFLLSEHGAASCQYPVPGIDSPHPTP